VEKHQGYAYEHAFAKRLNAIKGYHYMRLAHIFNILARFSKELAGLFAELGMRAAIVVIYYTLTGPWLDVNNNLKCPHFTGLKRTISRACCLENW
jgi:hypothetical protein